MSKNKPWAPKINLIGNYHYKIRVIAVSRKPDVLNTISIRKPNYYNSYDNIYS